MRACSYTYKLYTSGGDKRHRAPGAGGCWDCCQNIGDLRVPSSLLRRSCQFLVPLNISIHVIIHLHVPMFSPLFMNYLLFAINNIVTFILAG